MKTLINKIKPSNIIKVYKVYNKIKAFLNRFNPIAFTKVLKSLENKIDYLEIELNNNHNELIEMNDKIFKLDESLSRDIYDLNIDNRHYLGLCKRKDNDLNNDVKRCFEKINTLNTTMNKKFKALIDDDLQDSFYDFKEQHITPIKDDLKQVDTNKRHKKEIETSISSLDISQYSNILINKDNIEINKSDINCLLNKLNNYKEHIKSVEKLVNELCELNQLNKEV